MKLTYDLYKFKVASGAMRNFNYIVIDKSTGQAAIVDPSLDLDVILRTCHRLGVEPAAILLTHSHPDHVNMVNPLVAKFGSQVFMSAKEVAYYNFKCPNLNPVQDLDTIQLGDTPISCLLTPGHTAGSTCYLLADSLFTGDTIFIEGCGICDTEGGSASQMFASIQKIKSMVAPNVGIYPGHSFGESPGLPLSYLLKNNIYFLIELEAHFIQFRMRKNQKGLFDFK